jgi:hypothetical protein
MMRDPATQVQRKKFANRSASRSRASSSRHGNKPPDYSADIVMVSAMMR